MRVSKSDSPDPVSAGGQLTYTIDVFNDGPGQATNVQVSDDLPDDVTLLSVTPSSGGTCVTTSDPIVCTWPTLDAFGFEEVAIVVLQSACRPHLLGGCQRGHRGPSRSRRVEHKQQPHLVDFESGWCGC